MRQKPRDLKADFAAIKKIGLVAFERAVAAEADLPPERGGLSHLRSAKFSLDRSPPLKLGD